MHIFFKQKETNWQGISRLNVLSRVDYGGIQLVKIFLYLNIRLDVKLETNNFVIILSIYPDQLQATYNNQREN
jgi:hypothetical protein